MATYVVTQNPHNVSDSTEHRFKTRPPADHLLDQWRRQGSFARLVRWENNTPKEIAHVRHGILYIGLDSQIDWSNTLQVVELWERAKWRIREELDSPKTGSGFVQIVDNIVELMQLPENWSAKLQEVLREEGEPRSLLLV